MPITQARMHALLLDGEAQARALSSLREDIQCAIAASASPLTAISAISNILATSPLPARSALDRERALFDATKGKNERNARHMKGKRSVVV